MTAVDAFDTSTDTEEIITPESAIDRLDEILKENNSSGITIISTDQENVGWHPLTRERGRQLVTERPENLGRAIQESPLFASTVALAPPLAAADGPVPAGDVVAILITLAAAGVTAFEYYQSARTGIQVLEVTPNQHAIEQRGRELAYYIAHIVNTAFLGGNMPPNWQKRVLCFMGEAVEGLVKLGMWIVQVPSRSVEGAIRLAVALAGLDPKKGPTLVTLLYLGGYNSIEDFIREKIAREGLPWALDEECDDPSFLGPGFIEQVP